MRPALFALLVTLSQPALAGPPPYTDNPPPPQSQTMRDAAIQLAQSCVCHNPVGAAGETLCRRQRIVRCRANTRNQCGWEETNDRC